MTKNLKKAVRLIRSGQVITEERFPKNYEKAMTKVYGKQALTEKEFHDQNSVEQEGIERKKEDNL